MTTTHIFTATATIRVDEFTTRTIRVELPIDLAGASEIDIVDVFEDTIHTIREETEIGFMAPSRYRTRDIAGRVYSADDGIEVDCVRYLVEEVVEQAPEQDVYSYDEPHHPY